MNSNTNSTSTNSNNYQYEACVQANGGDSSSCDRMQTANSSSGAMTNVISIGAIVLLAVLIVIMIYRYHKKAQMKASGYSDTDREVTEDDENTFKY